jgi:hypothetical protein
MEVYKKMDCNKTNLRRGSKGEDVKTIQTLLTNFGYYTGRIDGIYGTYTEQAVKAYQKDKKLLADGIVGPVTCRALTGQKNETNTTPSHTSKEYTIFTNTKLCEQQKPDCLGQITPYHCGPHAIKQALRRFGITGYSERTIGNYAGTTTNGTSHSGIETAIAKIAQLEGITLQVKWVNFSDLGGTTKERWKKYGDLMTDDDKAVLHHERYRKIYGHYSNIKQVNTNSSLLVVGNSLGSRYGTGYYGYMETRPFSTQGQYFDGISQPSICIITKI